MGNDNIERNPVRTPLYNKASLALLDDFHNPGELDRRRARIDSPPVEELNAWVRRVRLGHDGDATVPWFDPNGGGDRARILLLLQDPSEVAAKGSGFISPDNNDATAQNTTLACRAAGIAAEARVHWNVYPWWVNTKGQDPHRPRETFNAAMRRAAPLIDELVNELLPNLDVVVLLGGEAQKGWDLYLRDGGRPPARVGVPLRCPHPSPLAWNKTDRDTGRRNRDLTIETLIEAAARPPHAA